MPKSSLHTGQARIHTGLLDPFARGFSAVRDWQNTVLNRTQKVKQFSLKHPYWRALFCWPPRFRANDNTQQAHTATLWVQKLVIFTYRKSCCKGPLPYNTAQASPFHQHYRLFTYTILTLGCSRTEEPL